MQKPPTADASGTNTAALTSRRAGITDADIQTVSNIFGEVQSKTLFEPDARTQLEKIVSDHNEAKLAWIVRNVPIYDGAAKSWFSFARYQDYSTMKFNLSSDLDIHPVDVTLGILFGRYHEPTQIFQ